MSLSKNGRLLADAVISRGAVKGMFQEERQPAWNEDTEDEYLERVRQRAQGQAKQIIAQAQAEAEEIKAAAYREGADRCRQEAEAALAAEQDKLENRFSQLMQSYQTEKDKLWQAHRQDIQELIRFAVEKVVGVEFQSRKQEILASLLDEALEELDSQAEVTVQVHEADEGVVREIVDQLGQAGSLRGTWTVRISREVSAGSLVLETREGRVDNSLQTRLEAVREILERIGLDGEPSAGGQGS